MTSDRSAHEVGEGIIEPRAAEGKDGERHPVLQPPEQHQVGEAHRHPDDPERRDRHAAHQVSPELPAEGPEEHEDQASTETTHDPLESEEESPGDHRDPRQVPNKKIWSVGPEQAVILVKPKDRYDKYQSKNEVSTQDDGGQPYGNTHGGHQ